MTKYIFGRMYIRKRESTSGRPLKTQLFNFAIHGIVPGHEAQMQTLLELPTRALGARARPWSAKINYARSDVMACGDC